MGRLLATEDEIQGAFIEWCELQVHRHPELELGYHIPNGGKRHPAVANKLKALGARAGILDWHLPVTDGVHIGLWIEFKSAEGTVKPKQRRVIALLTWAGHRVEVCRTTQLAIAVVMSYLAQRRLNGLTTPPPRAIVAVKC